MAEPPDLLSNQHPVALRLGRITDQVLEFYELVAKARTTDEMDALEALMKRNPKACAAKLRIAPTLLNKVLPSRSLIAHKTIPSEKPKGNLTANELKKMGLTEDQLRKLAGMVELPTEAEIVGGEET